MKGWSATLACVTIFFLMVSYSRAADLKYPAEWSKPAVSEDQCLPVSGGYAYRGERSKLSNPNIGPKYPLLDGTVFSRVPVRGVAENVDLRHDLRAGVISLSVTGKNLEAGQVTSFSQPVSCEAGWAVFRRLSSGYSDGHWVSSEGTTRLAKALDGSLIAHVSFKTESKYLFFFKTRREGEDWYRFLPSKTF